MKFQWVKVKLKEVNKITLSLLEILPDNKILFWASIDFNEIPYKFAAYSKKRVLQSVDNYDFYDLEKVQEAVEEYLFSEGILQEGDEVLTVLMGITGIGMGILDTLGGAYLFDGWRQKMPSAGKRWPFKFKILTGFVMSLFTVGLFILVPFTVSRVSHQSMFDVLEAVHLLWVWSLAVNLAPYILIGGVATSHKIVSSELDERSRSSQPVQANKLEPRHERPSDHEQEIYELLAEIYQREQRVANPTEIARLLNLNPHNAKGYIHGKIKMWVQANEQYINRS